MEKETTEQEEIQTVGAMLREARQKAGKTEADIAAELCIRKAYVTAIEEMDFANLPPRPFGIGFIRAYAEILGLNSDRIVSSYSQSLHEKREDKISAKVDNSGSSSPHFKHIFLGLCGLAALFAIWSVLPISEPVEDYNDENNDVIAEPVIVGDEEVTAATEQTPEENVEVAEEEMAADEEEVAVEEEIEPVIEPEEEAKADEEVADEISATEEVATEPEPSQFHKMRMVLNGPSWVEIKQGDKTVLRGSVYKRGFAYDIPQEEGLTVTVGRPQNAVFYVDEKPTKVVSVMNSKRVSLDEFLIKKDN